MQTILIVIHVLLAIALIGMILVQRGPGAAAGAAFGSGASSTVFGSRGAGSFLTRTTAILGAGFFLVSLTMAVMLSRGMFESEGPDLGIMSGLSQPQAEEGQQQPTQVPEQQPPVQDTETDPVPAPPPQDTASGNESEESSAVPEPPPGGTVDDGS